MNPKAARLVAELVGGEVMDSGGGVLTVEVECANGVRLVLGNDGWLIQSRDGEDIVVSYDVD